MFSFLRTQARLPTTSATSRAAAILALTLAAVACSSRPSDSITIHTPTGLAAGTEIAVTDLVADLYAISGRGIERTGLTLQQCRAGETHIVVLGHQHDVRGAEAPTELGPQAYSIDETRCGSDGHFVVLRGGSLLAAQWAVYDLLERLGVRYFHPEQTLLPTGLTWPVEPISVAVQPSLAHRSLHQHLVHPIEMSPPLGATLIETARYQRHWIDWNVKIRHTDVDAIDEAAIGSYAYDRGFPREASMNLLESQQGGKPIINPDDPRPEHEQISEAIERVMTPVAGMPAVGTFVFIFNPSEFTVAGEAITVDRLTFVTNYVHQRWPTVEIRTVNHGTASPLGPVYGVRFFDLPQFAPPKLTVEVHPLMFYDLDRPAPVYGNTNFQFFRDWIFTEQAKRRIYYYPESSWWLTFDLPVPLFLAPVSLEARDHDLKLLAPYLEGDNAATHGVVGHKSFSSGHEWGYWMIDYCTAHMTWNKDLGWQGCLDYVTQPFVAGAQLRDLLVEVGRAQVDPMRDPAILAMLVGSDDQTEAAKVAGIDFHPLPPAPSAVLGWDDAKVATFVRTSIDPMTSMATMYQGWADRADAIAAMQSEDHAPWVREIAQALRITGLRAVHARDLYNTALALRTAITTRDFAGIDAAAQRVDTVLASTAAARSIVKARETEYRYPLELSIAGDEPGSPGAVPNATIYPYRYLSRTHRLFYWTRPDQQLAAMFGFDLVSVNDRILPIGTALEPRVLANGLTDIALTWGDGVTSTVLGSHLYAAQGFYDWTLDALHSAGAIHHVDRVAIVAQRYTFAKGGLRITAPQGASIIESFFPGFQVGLGTDATGDFMALGQLDNPMTPVTKGTVQRRSRAGNASAASDLPINLPTLGTITIFGAVLAVADGAGPQARQLAITGELSTDEVIALVVTAGGFDLAGARDIVATTLGYTSATLPARLPVVLAATGQQD